MSLSLRIPPPRLFGELFFAAVLLGSALMSCSLSKPVACHDFSASTQSGASAGFVHENETVRTLAQIDLTTPRGRYPARAALIFRKPSFLRIELLPVIGAPEFILAASPEKMSVFIPGKNEFYTGSPSASNFTKFLPWPVEIDDMVMMLTGAYPSIVGKNDLNRIPEDNDARIVVVDSPSGCTQTVWLGDHDKLLERVLRDETGKMLYRTRYIYEGSSDVPEKIMMADGTTSLTIIFTDVKIEREADLSIFDLPEPADTKIIQLE